MNGGLQRGAAGNMSHFVHQRHKPPRELACPRELLLVCAPLRSNVNFSRIVRAASCCGLTRLVACGRPRIDSAVARIQAEDMQIEVHRTLAPLIARLKDDNYQIIGLEQSSGSECLYDFSFARRTALLVGNERQGLTAEVLSRVHRVVEIPVYGKPYSHNVATAVAMTLYEYCRQFPNG